LPVSPAHPNPNVAERKMTTKFTKDGGVTVEQITFNVPDLTIKDLLSAIP
jgi:hypothetical protein